MTIVDEPGLPRMVFDIMPDAVIIYRQVFSGHDQIPRNNDGGFWDGADWFNKLWPFMADVPATYYQFVNEWLGNGETAEAVRRFGDFYIELGMACLNRGVKCTMGDFSTGTPGYPTVPSEAHYLPALKAMLDFAEAHELPVNYHCYAPEPDGALDMAAGAMYYFMRWETLCKDHPKLIVIGGEGSNAGKDRTGRQGIFRPESLSLMKQAASMIDASPYRANFRAVNWWGINDASVHGPGEGGWGADDWSAILPQFFEWRANV